MLLYCLQLFNSANEITMASNELASPTGTPCFVVSSCLFESRINLKKNFSGYHTTGNNASVTAAITCGQKTCQLGLCSHVNDIVPLSYRSDFWKEIVDCVYTNPV